MKKLTSENIKLIVTDFDGVLTDNRVIVDENGKEAVVCNRSDGLAFDVLKKVELEIMILSTEKNSVVEKRANKLGVAAIGGSSNKLSSIEDICFKKGISMNEILYIGNDLNDYDCISNCGFTACPNDSHKKIKEIADYVLITNGGDGVIREIVEDILRLDTYNLLYG
ncbi:HAD hydrolase family protein [Gammaproteobacteria bacterium]|nr:HAD hydrolase family protein [Gammaproteobacteria bacterium]